MTDKKEPSSLKDIFAEIFEGMGARSEAKTEFKNLNPDEPIDVRDCMKVSAERGVLTIDISSSKSVGAAAFVVAVPAFVPRPATKIIAEKLRIFFEDIREWVQVVEAYHKELDATDDKLASALAGNIGKTEPANDTGGPAVS